MNLLIPHYLNCHVLIMPGLASFADPTNQGPRYPRIERAINLDRNCPDHAQQEPVPTPIGPILWHLWLLLFQAADSRQAKPGSSPKAQSTTFSPAWDSPRAFDGFRPLVYWGRLVDDGQFGRWRAISWNPAGRTIVKSFVFGRLYVAYRGRVRRETA